jgi:prophage regulatory protein
MVQELKAALVILRLKQVLARTGVSRSFLYQKMAEGLFPSCVRLGARAVGWIESEIDEWIAVQVKNSRTVPHTANILAETITLTAGVDAASMILSDELRPQSPQPPQHPSPRTSARTRTESIRGTARHQSKSDRGSHE